MKTFSFVPDHESEKQEMMVKGGDRDVSGHCKLAGLLLHCQAKNIQTGEMETSFPWHNFISDLIFLLRVGLLLTSGGLFSHVIKIWLEKSKQTHQT